MKSGNSGAEFWTTALDRRQRDGKVDHVQLFRMLIAEQSGQAQRRTDDETMKRIRKAWSGGSMGSEG